MVLEFFYLKSFAFFYLELGAFMSSISPGGSGNRKEFSPQDIPSEEVSEGTPLGNKKGKKVSGELQLGSKHAKVSTSSSDQGQASRVASTAYPNIDSETVGATAMSSSSIADLDSQELVQQLEDEKEKFLERLLSLGATVSDLFRELEDVEFSIEVFKHHDVLKSDSKDAKHSTSSSPQEQFREAVNRVGNQIILEKNSATLLATLKEAHRAAERILRATGDLIKALKGITPEDLRQVFPTCYESIMYELRELGIDFYDKEEAGVNYGWKIDSHRGLSLLLTKIQNLTDQGIQEIGKFHHAEASRGDPQISILRRFWVGFLQKLNQLYQYMLFFVFWVVRALRRLICGVEEPDPKIGNPQGIIEVHSQGFASGARARRSDLSEEDVIQRADSSSTSVESTRQEEEQNNDPGKNSDSEQEDPEQDEQNQKEERD